VASLESGRSDSTTSGTSGATLLITQSVRRFRIVGMPWRALFFEAVLQAIDESKCGRKDITRILRRTRTSVRSAKDESVPLHHGAENDLR